MDDKTSELLAKAKTIRSKNNLDADLQTVMLLLFLLEQKEGISEQDYESVIVNIYEANQTIEDHTVEEAGILAKDIPDEYLPDDVR